jgi:hypothetical protein
LIVTLKGRTMPHALAGEILSLLAALGQPAATRTFRNSSLHPRA